MEEKVARYYNWSQNNTPGIDSVSAMASAIEMAKAESLGKIAETLQQITTNPLESSSAKRLNLFVESLKGFPIQIDQV